MVNMVYKIGMGICGGAGTAAISAPIGALVGFIYAKLADLPANQVAKALAVWTAAEVAFQTFTHLLFSENRVARGLVKATLSIATTMIGIQELEKRGLIGEKMALLIIVIRAIGAANELLSAAYAVMDPHPSPLMK